MAKFQDEFFNKGSPEHDKLMIKTVSKTGMARILEGRAAPLDKLKALYAEELRLDEKEDDSLRACIEEGKVKNIYHKVAGERCGGRCAGCYSDKSNCQEKVVVVDVVATETATYETEVIMKSRDFIVGYADAVIKVVVTGHKVVKTSVGNFRVSERSIESATIVEAKPDLNSIGEVLRQLKTYQSLLPTKTDTPAEMVLTTYSDLDQDEIDFLAHEKIRVIKFDR